jgi:hypothetical protein
LVEGAEAGKLCGADFIEYDLQHGGEPSGWRAEGKAGMRGDDPRLRSGRRIANIQPCSPRSGRKRRNT